MEKELSLIEKKEIEKNILDYIVSICKKYKIQYFLAYGTLLGAVRHHGFIPWDDDIDLLLFRADYENLIMAILNDDNERYKVLYPEDNNGYYYSFAKVVDTYTKVEENNIDYNEKMGLWVDLFPLDGCKGSDSFHVRVISFLDKCRAAALNKTFPKHKYKKIMYLPWLLCRKLGYKYFLNLQISKSIKYSVKDSQFVDFLSSPTKRSIPKHLFYSPIELEFEGTLYSVPENYDELLTICYGDYMRLPPEKDRVTHNMRAVLIK